MEWQIVAMEQDIRRMMPSFPQFSSTLSSLGNQPVLICMDANATVEKSVTLQRILTTGKWHDVALTFSETEPDMTFCAKTTWNKIDKGCWCHQT